MSDKSDIEDTGNALNYPASDIDQMEKHDDMQQQDDDEFGSFDNAVEDDDDFGDFEEEELNRVDNTPIFHTIQDAMDLWHHLLGQIYHYEALDSFTGNAPKSIKQYVLEEAPESLHSRLTWDSVTRYMENDTGIPKVKWHQSEIERHHLNALACKRSATPMVASVPAMLNTDITQEPQPMMDLKPALDTVIGSNVPVADAPVVVDQPPKTPTSSSATTPEKRSSVFGLSSLSRFLPHLSKSNLPKSPTSSTSTTAPTSPITASQSLPRQQQGTLVNHLNVSTVKQQNASVLSSLKRSNSVAFTSRRKETIAPAVSMQTRHTAKPRPSSFQSMDLFDLTEDPATIVKSPTRLHFNLEPLVPTHALSPTPVRRNTIPASMHSHTKPNASLDTIQDDEFGDFTTQQKDNKDDFGDFSQEKPAPLKPVNFIDQDPFGITDSNSSTMTGSKPLDKDDSDPYGIASYAPHPPQPLPAQQSNHLFISLEQSSGFAPATVASPKVMTPTPFDLLAPIASGLHSQSPSADMGKATSDQTQPSPDGKAVVDDDDDDWGDWAF